RCPWPRTAGGRGSAAAARQSGSAGPPGRSHPGRSGPGPRWAAPAGAGARTCRPERAIRSRLRAGFALPSSRFAWTGRVNAPHGAASWTRTTRSARPRRAVSPRAVEKVTDHVCSLQLVAAIARPCRRARPEPVRAVRQIELAVAAHAVRRTDGGSAPVARLVGWAPHTLHSSAYPGGLVLNRAFVPGGTAGPADRWPGCRPAAHTGAIGRRGPGREDMDWRERAAPRHRSRAVLPGRAAGPAPAENLFHAGGSRCK